MAVLGGEIGCSLLAGAGGVKNWPDRINLQAAHIGKTLIVTRLGELAHYPPASGFPSGKSTAPGWSGHDDRVFESVSEVDRPKGNLAIFAM
jgi:hypothetical protein